MATLTRNDTPHFAEGTRFLVTGGAGFIGSNLVDHLLERGFFTRVLDDFSTGREENLAHLQNASGFDLIRGDLRNPETCAAASRDIDIVLHQGALGSVPRSVEDPRTSNDVNIGGTLNIFIAARDAGVKRVVYASSSSVYGDDPAGTKREEQLGKVLSPYALTKLANELYGDLFYQLYGLQNIGLRYFNVFGRRQDPHSVYAAVIPIFVKALLAGEAPTIFGDGLQSRDFTYIDNVIQANLLAAAAPAAACGRAYNISFGENTTLLDLYEKLCSLLGRSIPPLHGADRPGDIRHSLADISLAREHLGYAPRFSIDDGLSATIDWYVKHLS